MNQRHLVFAGYSDAMHILDASNTIGLLEWMPNIATAITCDVERLGFGSTASRNFHPLSVLVASKLHDLAGLGVGDTFRYGLAYDLARRVTSGNLVVTDPKYTAALRKYLVEFDHPTVIGV